MGETGKMMKFRKHILLLSLFLFVSVNLFAINEFDFDLNITYPEKIYVIGDRGSPITFQEYIKSK